MLRPREGAAGDTASVIAATPPDDVALPDISTGCVFHIATETRDGIPTQAEQVGLTVV